MEELKDRVIALVKEQGYNVIVDEHTPEQYEANGGSHCNYYIEGTDRKFTMNNWYLSGMIYTYGLSADAAIAKMVLEGITK
jgi:hypothetical protein